jgi:hypothetical protein
MLYLMQKEVLTEGTFSFKWQRSAWPEFCMRRGKARFSGASGGANLVLSLLFRPVAIATVVALKGL